MGGETKRSRGKMLGMTELTPIERFVHWYSNRRPVSGGGSDRWEAWGLGIGCLITAGILIWMLVTDTGYW